MGICSVEVAVSAGGSVRERVTFMVDTLQPARLRLGAIVTRELGLAG